VRNRQERGGLARLISALQLQAEALDPACQDDVLGPTCRPTGPGRLLNN
jgi:hypothetical protein